MAVQYLSNVKNPYGLWCYVFFALRALGEILVSILRRPFLRSISEVPEVTCAPTPFNQRLLEKLREGALAKFEPLWCAHSFCSII